MVESRPAKNVNCLVSVENNNEAYIFILSHCFTQNVHIQIDRTPHHSSKEKNSQNAKA